MHSRREFFKSTRSHRKPHLSAATAIAAMTYATITRDEARLCAVVLKWFVCSQVHVRHPAASSPLDLSSCAQATRVRAVAPSGEVSIIAARRARLHSEGTPLRLLEPLIHQNCLLAEDGVTLHHHRPRECRRGAAHVRADTWARVTLRSTTRPLGHRRHHRSALTGSRVQAATELMDELALRYERAS